MLACSDAPRMNTPGQPGARCSPPARARTINVHMTFLSPPQRAFLQAVSQLAYANPFLPERVAYERAALGEAFIPGEPVWSQHVHDPEQPRANVWRVVERLETLATQLQAD